MTEKYAATQGMKTVLALERMLVELGQALGLKQLDVAATLNACAKQYYDQGQYVQAVPYALRALEIREKQLGAEHLDVTQSLNNLAALYGKLARYTDAEPLYQRALAIREKALGTEHPDVATSLNNLAVLCHAQARYTDAEPLYQRALAIWKKALGTKHPRVAVGLNNLAGLRQSQARYAEAEQLYKRALVIRKKRWGEEHPDVAQGLNKLAELYCAQAQYARAEPLFHCALAIREKTLGAEHPDVATSLDGLAGLCASQARYADAELLYKRSLAILEKRLGAEHPNVALSLNNLAELYYAQEQYDEAEPLLERALEIREKALGTEHPDVAISLHNLAALYHKQARYADVEPLFKRALSIAACGGQPELLWSVQGNLSTLYTKSNPNLAIFYGKQAVNTLQRVRESNISMHMASQRGFLKSKENYYTLLADMLFTKNRLTEGQQVLAMLKEAEYHEFMGKGDDDPRRSRVDYSPREAKWEQKFQNLTEKPATADLESAQYAAAKKEMDAFFEDVKRAFASGADGADNRLDNTSPLQKPLAQLGEGTVLVQYLMPQESLWILVTTKSSMKAQQVDISADALTKKINAFKQAIVAESLEVDALGKELYGLLIAPVAEDLKGANTLMLAPDGALRYLPFAALHDGEQYLAQRYVLSNYTDMSKDRITDKPAAQWSFAGFGVSEKVCDGYDALPWVAKELQGIRDNAMQGKIWLNEVFTRDALQDALRKPPPVVHVASHFEFTSGDEHNSFLLLGDGSKLTLADIRENYRFNGVDLVALSACETAVGDGEDENGREVEGFGVLVQLLGAKGVLASLWEVDDESTGQLMQLFYGYRHRRGLSKAEALREAQLAFIEGRVAAALSEMSLDPGDGGKAKLFRHPFYWAPFILMGNWL